MKEEIFELQVTQSELFFILALAVTCEVTSERLSIMARKRGDAQLAEFREARRDKAKGIADKIEKLRFGI